MRNSNTGYLVIDVETIPNQHIERPAFDPDSVKLGNIKDPLKAAEKIAEARAGWDAGLTKTMSVSADMCEIVSLGFIELDRFMIEKRRDTFIYDEGDAGIIEAFASVYRNQRIITWNGKGFDIPVIWKRGIASGVDVFRGRYIDLTNRYKHEEHADLMHIWNNFDYGKLKACAAFLGLPAKEGMDGSMIYDAWQDGKIEEIRAYNMQDCECTLAIAERLGIAVADKE